MRVLILGGAGVFGGRLARLIDAHRPEVRIIIAGRSAAKARAAAERLTRLAEHAAIDRDGDLAAAFASLAPEVVIDAAGPFQLYGGDDPRRAYRVAEAALGAGAHYLDLSDDAAFTEGVSTLDALARMAGRVALSGVSSTPALSAAVAAELTKGLEEVALIDTAILPGNRAPRGLSVMRAILSQVGKPLKCWRGGEWRESVAWGPARRIDVSGLGTRRASPIGAPELALFPRRFGARSVRFEAGLELRALHDGLRLFAALARRGWLRSLESYARSFKRVADWMAPFGSDRGGMRVLAAGRRADGAARERAWSLAIGSGDGPSAPAIPAFVLLDRLDGLEPGARPCLDEAPLAAFEAGLSLLDAEIEGVDGPAPRLFEAALGPARWGALPGPVRRLHDIWDIERFVGEGEVRRGANLLARLAAEIIGLPRSAARTPVAVEIERRGEVEIWRRRFGRAAFRSVVGKGAPGRVEERWGPLRAEIEFRLEGGALVWEVTGARFLGVRLPSRLAPSGAFRESADDKGRFAFHVDIRAPLVGRIALYRGWLRPAGAVERAPG